MYSKYQLSISLLFIAAFLSLALNGEFNGPEIPTGPYELSYPANFGNRINIPEDRQLTKQEVYLGRMLFYETKLSINNKISCATCHKQTLAFTDGKKFSTGVDGTLTKRNSMSLTNLLWVRNFFWDGRNKSLEEQAKVPAIDPHEMGQSLEASARKLQHTGNYAAIFNKVYGTTSITGQQIVNAIAQFERTLISANSSYDKYLAGEYLPSDEELNGLKLFTTMPGPEKNIRGANCVHCHGMPKTFSEMFHNNGLDSIANDSGREQFTGQAIDRGRFRVPTLRNIAITLYA